MNQISINLHKKNDKMVGLLFDEATLAISSPAKPQQSPRLIPA